MSQKIYLHIKEPCHENWDVMSPVEQGRFCNSCAKQVVDFSRMSDQQILNVLSKAAGNTCGRFLDSQLERPVVQEIPYSLKPYKIVLSSLVPLFILSVHASGQDKLLTGEVAVCTNNIPKKNPVSHQIKPQERYPVMMGLITMPVPEKHQQQGFKPKTVIAKSTVVSEQAQPLSHVNAIRNPPDKNASVKPEKPFLKPTKVNPAIIATPIVNQVVITKPGYDNDFLHNTLEPVTVTGFDSPLCVVRLGGISMVRTVTRVDTARTFIQKLFNNDMFKAFPNPASKGQNVNLRFRKEGDYMIQLFDNSGKLYVEKQIFLSGKEMISQLTIPVTFSSGVYYVKAVNVAIKKDYIEKIIVK